MSQFNDLSYAEAEVERRWACLQGLFDRKIDDRKMRRNGRGMWLTDFVRALCPHQFFCQVCW
jgi:hypothetical protein